MIAGLVLTGCTDSQSGEPVAAGQTPGPGGAPSGGQPSVNIPPRPRDISLEGLDPCKLFTQAQLDQLKITRKRNLVQDKDTFKGAPLCAMDGEQDRTSFGYTAWLVTTEGFDLWLNGKRNADAKLVSVDGFPAATYKIRGTSSFHCWTSVGVANGQQLAVEFAPVTRNAFTQEQMCQKSEQAATLAMQTLKTLK